MPKESKGPTIQPFHHWEGGEMFWTAMDKDGQPIAFVVKQGKTLFAFGLGAPSVGYDKFERTSKAAKTVLLSLIKANVGKPVPMGPEANVFDEAIVAFDKTVEEARKA